MYILCIFFYISIKKNLLPANTIKILQESIIEWSQIFIKTFQYISPSELKLLKLHSWIYHIVNSIRSFGAVNGFTTETYESLHKEYVKAPYRLSNKKNIEVQLMKIVCKKVADLKKKLKKKKFLQIRRQSIFKLSQNQSSAKTPRTINFTTKIFEFLLKNLHTFVAEANLEQIDNKMKLGFSKFFGMSKFVSRSAT